MTEDLSIETLLEHGELVDVRTLAFSCAVLEEPNEELDDEHMERSTQVMVGVGEAAVEIRLDVSVRTGAAEYSVVVATQFHHDLGIEIPEPLGRELAEKVGAMAIWPYVRQAIQDFSTALRQETIVLPLLRQGELQLSLQESTPE